MYHIEAPAITLLVIDEPVVPLIIEPLIIE